MVLGHVRQGLARTFRPQLAQTETRRLHHLRLVPEMLADECHEIVTWVAGPPCELGDAPPDGSGGIVESPPEIGQRGRTEAHERPERCLADPGVLVRQRPAGSGLVAPVTGRGGRSFAARGLITASSVQG